MDKQFIPERQADGSIVYVIAFVARPSLLDRLRRLLGAR
jgi:hypothetical protein